MRAYLYALSLLMSAALAAHQGNHYTLNLIGVLPSSDAEVEAVADWRALLFNEPPRPPRPHRESSQQPLGLSVTLESLDGTIYVVGDEISYSFVVHNTSKAAIKFPTSRRVHLFRRQMPGAVRAQFWLTFDDDVLGSQVFGLGATYGAEAVRNSLLLLQPGDSVTIQFRSDVRPSKRDGAPDEWLRVVNLALGLGLFPVTGEPYGDVKSGNEMAVQISSPQ